MPEKFFGNGGSSDWSEFRKLEAEGKARAEAAAKEKKEKAALDAQQQRIMKRRAAQLTKQLPKEPAVNDGPHVVPEHPSPTSSVFENDDSRGDEFEHLERHRSSRRAVYEETGGRVGKRQAAETIGGRLRPGSKDLVRGGVDITPKDPEMARWKKRSDLTHFESVEQQRRRKAADLKRNARRGASIRDLEEVPLAERSKGFTNALDEISSEVSDHQIHDARGSASSSREESTRLRNEKEAPHADREDEQPLLSRSQGRETIRRVPRNQLRASQEQGRSLHQDPVIRQKTSDRFTQQDKRRREEQRVTWRSLLEGIQGFFRR